MKWWACDFQVNFWTCRISNKVSTTTACSYKVVMLHVHVELQEPGSNGVYTICVFLSYSR